MFNLPSPSEGSEWFAGKAKDMTCEREMDLFFVRNCYSEKEREKVKASLAYRQAMEQSDAIQAQEVATRVLEGK
jgi:hypothetical protein